MNDIRSMYFIIIVPRFLSNAHRFISKQFYEPILPTTIITSMLYIAICMAFEGLTHIPRCRQVLVLQRMRERNTILTLFNHTI